MRFYKNLFLGFCFVLSAVILRGQNISYKLYTPHDGLAQSQVTCMFQDSRGYIWVGTNGGISYFNGTKFQSILPKDGLPSAAIGQIQEDDKGNIWFYTGKWLCKYDGKKVTADTTSIRFHSGYFCLDHEKTMWIIGANDNKLYYSKDWKNWTCASDEYPTLKDKKWAIFDIGPTFNRLNLRDITNDSYVFNKGELKKMHTSQVSFTDAGSNMRQNLVFAKDSVFEIKDSGLVFLNKSNGIQARYGIKRANGKIYFNRLYGNTIYALDKAGKIDSFVFKETINFLFIDKNENVWAASEQGLFRLFFDGFKNFKKEELSDTWSMVEDTEGGMWFGDYYTHKLHRYDGKKIVEKKIDYALFPTYPKGDLADFYFGGGRDKLGNLYFPSATGIKKWDGKRFSLLTPFGNENHNISMTFYLDTLRNIIVSGTAGGFNIVQLKNGASKFYGQEKGVYCNGYILGVAKDGKGRYWLSTSRGVSVFDMARDTVVQTYTAQKKTFPYFGCSNIFGDVKGNIWAGSAQGLLRYDEQKDSFVVVAANTIQTSVNALAAYKDKYLVVGASDGLYFLDLKAFYTVEERNPDDIEKGGKTIVRCFNQNNGYLGIEPNQNCLYVDSKDNVWVAASDIVTKITPSELDMMPKPLIPYITSINNNRIPYESYQQTISLPYGLNTAKIFFEAVGFERPFNTEFSYKLDDEKWSEWRPEDFAVLDNLSSGTYTFSVRTRPAGTANESDIKETHIELKINIPIFKESYFPFLAAFLILGSAFGSWYFIRKQQQREEKAHRQHQIYIQKQDALDKERTRQMKYLQIQTLQAQLNPHFIFNVLQAIQTRIYEGNRETASGLIVDLGNLIRRFLESSVSMDMSKMRNSEITLKQEINLLQSYIEFEQLQYSNRFDYQIQVDEDIDAENVQVPPMLIQPYIENAIKHGILYEKERRCQLTVRFRKTDDDRLVCTITDNGVGRKRAKEIQDSFIRMYKSRGTQILEDRIKIMQELGHGISVETHDNPEGGTIVELKIDM